MAGRFIGAPDPAHEIVFTKNTTESLNLVAHSWGRANLRAGDAVLLTEMEHHANIVPWMILAEELGGLDLRYIPIDGDGRLVLDDLDRLVDGVKLVGISAMSNVLGTINPVAHDRRGGARRRRRRGRRRRAARPARTGRRQRRWASTSSPSRRHKMMGPTGIGVLWGRAELLDAMPPFLGGGGMILDVKLDSFRPAPPPRPVRGGHAAHRRGGRAHRGHRVPAATSGWTASAPTSWR